MLPQFNPIVLDVVVVVLLLSVLTLGLFKGIKHTLINFVLLLSSFALAFSPLVNVVKIYIIDFASKYVKFSAGASDALKLGVNFIYVFAASLILTILFYAILRILKLVICSFIKRSRLKANKLERLPSKSSRMFGGLASLVLNGAVVLIFLSVFTSPLVGGNKTSQITYVTKYVDMGDDYVIDLFTDNELVEEHIMIRLLEGNLYIKTEQIDAENLKTASELIENNELVPTSLEDVQENINKMEKLLTFVVKHTLVEQNVDGKIVYVEKDGFESSVKLIKDILTKAINSYNTLNEGNDPINAKNTKSIQNSLAKLGLDDLSEMFSDIFVIQS